MHAMTTRFLSQFVRGISALVLFATVQPVVRQPVAAQQTGCQTFAQTGKDVCGRFLAYWREHGGLAQQGYPITSEISEVSEVDGKRHTMQYFERAVFESHPENRPPYDVLLSLLGSMAYGQRYPAGASGQKPDSSPGSVLFPQTGKRLGGK